MTSLSDTNLDQLAAYLACTSQMNTIVSTNGDNRHDGAARDELAAIRLHSWVVTDHKNWADVYNIWPGVPRSRGCGGFTDAHSACRAEQPFRTRPRFSTNCSALCMAHHDGIPCGHASYFGFANFLVPVDDRRAGSGVPARLNAFGFWLSAFGGLLLYFSLLGGMGLTGAGSAPDVGWFAYSPLTAKTFSRGHSTDYWTLGVMISTGFEASPRQRTF